MGGRLGRSGGVWGDGVPGWRSRGGRRRGEGGRLRGVGGGGGCRVLGPLFVCLVVVYIRALKAIDESLGGYRYMLGSHC